MITIKKEDIHLKKTTSHPGYNSNDSDPEAPEILFITSYPPRECGIATYSQDLLKALDTKFRHSFILSICPLESENETHNYTDAWLPDGQVIKYTLNTDQQDGFTTLSKTINDNASIRMVVVQH